MPNSTANQIIQPKSRTLILYADEVYDCDSDCECIDVALIEVLGILVETSRPFCSSKAGIEAGVIDYLVAEIIQDAISGCSDPYWLNFANRRNETYYREFIWNAWPPEKDEEMICGGFAAFRERAASVMEIKPWSSKEHAAREAKGLPV